MDCRKFTKDLCAYIAKDLSQEAYEAMAKHLEQCESCKSLYEYELKRYKQLLSMESVDASDYSSQRVEILNGIDKNRYGGSIMSRLSFFLKKNFLKYAATGITATAIIFICIFSIGYFKEINSRNNIAERPNKENTQPANTDQIAVPPVEPPSTTPVDTPVQENNPRMYSNEKLGISFTFLDSWDGKYTIKESEDGITVYFKSSDDTLLNNALLFCILAKSNTNSKYTDIIGQPRSFSAKGINYIVGGPTGGFDPSYKEYTEFLKMHDEVKDIVKTIKVVSSPQNNSGKIEDEVFFGEWTITRVVTSLSAGTYSKEDINNIIGKKMIFSKEKASSFGDNLESYDVEVNYPIYEKTLRSKEYFLTNWKIGFKQLGIICDSILEINVKGSSQGGCTLFLKEDGTMLVYGGGSFFELKKTSSLSEN